MSSRSNIERDDAGEPRRKPVGRADTIGTQNNTQAAEAKRRKPPRFLTAEERAAVCAEFAEGNITKEALGKRYGVTGVTIGKVILERTERVVALLPPSPPDSAPMAIIDRTEIRIPRTSARSAQNVYAKLLSRVNPDAQTGLDFHGKFLQPGCATSLWPSPEFPRVPILLECAGVQKAGRIDRDDDGRCTRRSEYLYLLWRYDEHEHDWTEIARSRSSSRTWIVELAPVARRLLQEANGHAGVDVLPSLEGNKIRIINRIIAAFAEECTNLDATDRKQLGNLMENVVHDEVGALIAGTWNRTAPPGLS